MQCRLSLPRFKNSRSFRANCLRWRRSVGQAAREYSPAGVAPLSLMRRTVRSVAKRGQQANLSFFAFTATPKYKTLAVFGHNKRATHYYTMHQAIEEGFI